MKKSNIFMYTLFKVKTLTLQRGEYGPMEGTRARGYQKHHMCTRVGVFRILFNFFEYDLLKMWKKMIFWGRHYSKATPWPCKAVIMVLQRARVHQYVMCAVYMRDAVFRITFIFLHLNTLKWEKHEFLGRHYSKASPWPCKGVIMDPYEDMTAKRPIRLCVRSANTYFYLKMKWPEHLWRCWIYLHFYLQLHLTISRLNFSPGVYITPWVSRVSDD